MITNKIKDLLVEKNKQVKDLCDYIEMSDAGLRKIYKRDSCEVSTLLKIADFFNVSPCYFFEDAEKVSVRAGDNSVAVGGNANDVNSFKTIHELVKEISAQRNLTERAMNQIEVLTETINQLSKKG